MLILSSESQKSSLSSMWAGLPDNTEGVLPKLPSTVSFHSEKNTICSIFVLSISFLKISKFYTIAKKTHNKDQQGHTAKGDRICHKDKLHWRLHHNIRCKLKLWVQRKDAIVLLLRLENVQHLDCAFVDHSAVSSCRTNRAGLFIKQ